MLAWGPGTGAVGSGAHPYNLEINSVDWIASLRDGSLSIEMPGPGTNGSMSFTLHDPTTAISIAEWDEVRFLEHAASRPTLFGGFVQSVRFVVRRGIAGREIEVQCVGYGILLDKKVFTGDPRVDRTWYPPGVLADWINRDGGILHASAPTFSMTPTPMGVDYSIAMDGLNSLRIEPSEAWTPPAPSSLRSAIEALLTNVRQYITGLPWVLEDALSYAYWVDSYARVVAVPNFPSTVAAAIFACNFDSGTVPGMAIDLVGSHRVEGLAYEREDTDRITSVYVVGSNQVEPTTDQTEDAARIVASVDMKKGFYTVANSQPTWGSGFVAIVTHTATSTVDEHLGTLLLTGRDLYGVDQTEVITPLANAVASGSQVWDRVTKVEGRGWKVTAGADHITVGHTADAYAVGLGTGWYRSQGLERAGDLATIVNASESVAVADIAAFGSGAVSITEPSTARGSISIASDTPLDAWPGRHMTVDAPAAGLSSSQDWRMTSVGIAFRTPANRVYTIGFGGNLPAPSMARRSGRFATR